MDHTSLISFVIVKGDQNSGASDLHSVVRLKLELPKRFCKDIENLTK